MLSLNAETYQLALSESRGAEARQLCPQNKGWINVFKH